MSRREVVFYTDEERRRPFAAGAIASWAVTITLVLALLAVLLVLSPEAAEYLR